MRTIVLILLLFALDLTAEEEVPFFFRLHRLVIKMQDPVLYSKNVYKRELEQLLHSKRHSRIDTGYDYVTYSPLELDRQYRGVVSYSNWLLIRINSFAEEAAISPERYALYSISGTLTDFRVDPSSTYPLILYLSDARLKKLEEN